MKKDSGTSAKRILKIAHSPDADDRFMFWPIRSKRLEHPQFDFEFFEADTQKLNALATTGLPDVCAISAIHYARVFDNYQPMVMGASVGNNYGPVLVAEKLHTKIEGLLISPGRQTTAHAVLQILAKIGGFEFKNVEEVSISPLSLVFETLRQRLNQKVRSNALLIHEGRLTYEKEGFVKLLDIGEKWHSEFQCSLPLGINVIARRLPTIVRKELSQFFVSSCLYAQKHLDDFVAENATDGQKWMRGGSLHGDSSPTLNSQQLKHYLSLYANETTIRISSEDARSFETLLQLAWKFKVLDDVQTSSASIVDWI